MITYFFFLICPGSGSNLEMKIFFPSYFCVQLGTSGTRTNFMVGNRRWSVASPNVPDFCALNVRGTCFPAGWNEVLSVFPGITKRHFPCVLLAPFINCLLPSTNLPAYKSEGSYRMEWSADLNLQQKQENLLTNILHQSVFYAHMCVWGSGCKRNR